MVATFPSPNNYADFGGTKQDYSTIVNINTDYSADNINTLGACVAGISRVANRGFVRFTAGASPSIATWNTGWKSQTPTLPIIVNSSTGVYVITFPASVSDALGNPVNVNFQWAQATIEGTNFNAVTNANVSSANTLIINCGQSGSANNLSGTVIVLTFA